MIPLRRLSYHTTLLRRNGLTLAAIAAELNAISVRLSEWCEEQGGTLYWIKPGKQMQNAYIERFNGSFLREILAAHLFYSLTHVRQLVNEWMLDYNTQRPQQALNFMIPIKFKQAA